MLENRRNERPVRVTPKVTEPVVKEEAIEEVIDVAVKGEVICEKLYVRSETNKESAAICILDKGTVVTISDINASADFYKVLGNGFEGYCMKKFIAIKAD